MCVFVFPTLSLKFSRICLSKKGLQRSAPFRNAWFHSSQKRLLTKGRQNMFIGLLRQTNKQSILSLSSGYYYICFCNMSMTYQGLRVWVGWRSSLWPGHTAAPLRSPYTEKLRWCLVGTDPVNWLLWWTWCRVQQGYIYYTGQHRNTLQTGTAAALDWLTWTRPPSSSRPNWRPPHVCDSEPGYRKCKVSNVLFCRKCVFA